MPHDSAKFPIAVVSACMSSDGTPTFTLYEVQVSHDEHENGVHYSLVETYLADDGYEEPYVHFDEREAPPFLFSAVREYLGLPAENSQKANALSTEDP
jgi:hypothetical protein